MELAAETIWLPTAVVEMRTGIHGLSLVCSDSIGVWMRLRLPRRGQFVRPQADHASWQMSAKHCRWMIAGVDWQRASVFAPAQWWT